MRRFLKIIIAATALIAIFPCSIIADPVNLIPNGDCTVNKSYAEIYNYWYYDIWTVNYNQYYPEIYNAATLESTKNNTNNGYYNTWMYMKELSYAGGMFYMPMSAGGKYKYGSKSGYELSLEAGKEYLFECDLAAISQDAYDTTIPHVQISISDGSTDWVSKSYDLNKTTGDIIGSFFLTTTSPHTHVHFTFTPTVTGNHYLTFTNSSTSQYGSSVGMHMVAVDMLLCENTDKNRIRAYEGYIPKDDNDNCCEKSKEMTNAVANRIVLTEGYGYTNKDYPISATEVQYQRILKNQEWQSVCLPYDVPYATWSAEYDAIKLVSDAGDAAVFSYLATDEDLVKHKPYLLRPKAYNSKIVLNVSDAIVDKANPGSDTAGTLTLTGTYEITKMYGAGGTSTRYGLSEGEFKYTTNESKTLKPFRAYLTENNASATALRNIPMKIEDENQDNETNGIDSAIADCEEGVFYDLSGKKVDNPQAGLYIFNGKKIILKR